MAGKYGYMPIDGRTSRATDFAGTGLDILTVETTQRHAYGRRYLDWDGSVFVYGHSLSALYSGFGAANIAPQNIGAVIPVGAKVGDRQVTVTIASGDGYAGDGVIAENELMLGRFVAGHGEALVQNRIIMGNTAVASGGGTSKLTLNRAITNALTASSSYVEILLNPDRYLAKGAYQYNAFMSVPAVNVAATGYNFWGQTWGPCWLCPGGADATPGNTIHDRMMYFVGDGSVNGGDYLAAAEAYQPAGWLMDMTSAALSAMPMVFLTIRR